MATKYVKRSGDRPDGRRLRSLSGFFDFIPYIMPDRNDAMLFYEQSFDITEVEKWLRVQRDNGYKGMGMLHLFIAAYIRVIASLPALNRFVIGRRIYSHDDITVVMAVKRSLALDAPETTVKVHFSPSDTVYDVYRKLNAEIDKVKSGEDNDVESFTARAKKLPRFVLRFILWVIRVLDYLGKLPARAIELSPFHGSMMITDLGSLGVSPVFHHIYNFGTLPVFISFGAKRKTYDICDGGRCTVERKYVDAKITLDERIVDGHYYASVIKLLGTYVKDPTKLEVPPEIVKQDTF